MAFIRPSAIPGHEARWARDRIVILIGVVAVALAGWSYLLYDASRMAVMHASGMGEPAVRGWQAADFAVVFIMWAAMMAAMMLPGAMPTLLLFAHAHRNRSSAAVLPGWYFAAGYVAAWALFSVAATLAQWGLHEAALLSPMMLLSDRRVAGALLFGVGVYQFTPFKATCLRHCQSPLGFLLSRWRNGLSGAFRMGFSHGSYCVGCCWALMGILFAVGVMNVAWVAGVAAFVAIEKLFPVLRYPAGLVLIGCAMWLLLSGTTP
jgi:predicted metal-binding membrane protein